jgi:uncharacterized RDD family membrane protein YckC
MSDEQPAEFPVDRADPESPSVTPPGALRETRPGFCPDCNAAVPGDAHFCPSCHVFVPDRWVGHLAAPKRRLVAALLDGIFKEGGLFGMALWSAVLPPGIAGAVVRVMSLLYGVSALVLWSQGTTPAKRFLGMTVITEDGKPAGFFRMAFRETIGKWISTIAIGLGLLAVSTDKEKRGWHDSMAGTWVVHNDDE